MKKRLNETQFQVAIASLGVGQQTIDIAHGVLVEGRPQVEFANSLGLTKGAISQAVSRVWTAAEKVFFPKDWERVTVELPKHQAFIVRQWALAAKRKHRHKI